MKEFREVTGNKINMQKSITFMYLNNKLINKRWGKRGRENPHLQQQQKCLHVNICPLQL